MFGCQVKEENEFAPEGKGFTATVEELGGSSAGVATKTTLDEEGHVLWNRGDQVTIFAASTINDCYQVSDAADGSKVATLDKVGSSSPEAGLEISNHVAFYPYTSGAKVAKSGNSYVISGVALPAKQFYSEGSFGSGAFPMAAVTRSTTDYNLRFKNILGCLKLQLKGTATIASISVTGNKNEIICGSATVTVSNNGAPEINMTGATAKVTMDCGAGVKLSSTTATSFIIALPPVTMTNGFTVVITDTENHQMEIKTTRPQTISRSSVLTMPAFTFICADQVTEDAVDLGLPSHLKWAACNLGANSPVEYGDYYAWGDKDTYYTSQNPLTWRDGKDGYNWQSYKFFLHEVFDVIEFSKYNTNSSHGVVDNKAVLEMSDDAAYAKLGGNWHVPTDAEWTELRSNCSWIWTKLNDVSGLLVAGPNGSSLFLPAAGFWKYGAQSDAGSAGNYWSSSLYTDNSDSAWSMCFRSGNITKGSSLRYLGFSVRPVNDGAARVPATSMALSQSSLNLTAGKTATLSAIFTPSNANRTTVLWSSSDATVATVSHDGVVTAVAAGTAVITATAYDGGFAATCSVVVSNLDDSLPGDDVPYDPSHDGEL